MNFNFPDWFGSKKLKALLLGILLLLLRDVLGLPPEVIDWIMQLVAIYIGGQSLVDFSRELRKKD